MESRLAVKMQKVIELVKSTKDIIFNETLINTRKEKGAADYVTLVDIRVQEFIFQGLKSMYPDYQFMGEEEKIHSLDLTQPIWLLDPLDGTTNLIHNYNQSAVSLALWKNGRLEFGVIYNPYTDELFTGYLNKGAYLNGKPIRVSNYTSMSDSLITMGTHPYNKKDSKDTFLIAHKIYMDCQDIRRSGSAALDMAYVAAGRIEAFFEKFLSPWDYAAGAIIVQEAGGTVTTFDNKPLPIFSRSSVLATNGAVHSKMLEYLSE
ncbi:MAG: inositol monophosphatase family protein [Caldicoprobacterales bacterium]